MNKYNKTHQRDEENGDPFFVLLKDNFKYQRNTNERSKYISWSSQVNIHFCIFFFSQVVFIFSLFVNFIFDLNSSCELCCTYLHLFCLLKSRRHQYGLIYSCLLQLESILQNMTNKFVQYKRVHGEDLFRSLDEKYNSSSYSNIL